MRFSVSAGKGRKTPAKLGKRTHVHTCGVRTGNAVLTNDIPPPRSDDQIRLCFSFFVLIESVQYLEEKKQLPMSNSLHITPL